MESERLVALLQKHRTIKQNVHLFKEYVERFDTNDPASFTELEIRSQEIKSCVSSFDEICDEIYLLDPNADFSSSKKSLQNMYYQMLGKARYFFDNAGLGVNSSRDHSLTRESFFRSSMNEAYGDERILISRHTKLLFTLAVAGKETREGLIRLMDESKQHVQSSSSLGVVILPEMVVTIIEEKLHKTTSEKWEDTVTMGSFPKLEQMYLFLRNMASRDSKRRGDHLNSNDLTEKSNNLKNHMG
ncbi:hypothetical protein QAD02_014147 [Eretmocerus hayati]|uniref:Uncharacterized protein n=1 Tax=Eretmocerus hayati TaxID=131215 RepID=A0ACC2P9A8_9HYME|nr:hypothetical protein QAD02_014147 [Eretmocerus hayati]